jgi:hypothetical protein
MIAMTDGKPSGFIIILLFYSLYILAMTITSTTSTTTMPTPTMTTLTMGYAYVNYLNTSDGTNISVYFFPTQ